MHPQTFTNKLHTFLLALRVKPPSVFDIISAGRWRGHPSPHQRSSDSWSGRFVKHTLAPRQRIIQVTENERGPHTAPGLSRRRRRTGASTRKRANYRSNLEVWWLPAWRRAVDTQLLGYSWGGALFPREQGHKSRIATCLRCRRDNS